MNIIKKITRKPRLCLSLIKRTLCHLYESNIDAYHYLSHSTVLGDFMGNKSAHLQSDIIRLYHVIEKGLSMPEFRPRAGSNSVKQLHSSLQIWQGPCDTQISSAWKVLAAYRDRHLNLGIDISDIIPDDFKVPEQCDTTACGGVKPYHAPKPEECEAFFNVMRSRASIRNFDTKRIPEESILAHAVTTAMSTPSVCNRQTWKAHLYRGQKAQNLLKFQNGNRGFGHTIPALFIITSDLSMFTGTSERYQAWIDGGMFSMSLLLALHAEGLGAVSLNWSVLNKRDQQLRKEAKIAGYERVIMLIGCGYPSRHLCVPVSTRRPTVDVFISHN